MPAVVGALHRQAEGTRGAWWVPTCVLKQPNTAQVQEKSAGAIGRNSRGARCLGGRRGRHARHKQRGRRDCRAGWRQGGAVLLHLLASSRRRGIHCSCRAGGRCSFAAGLLKVGSRHRHCRMPRKLSSCSCGHHAGLLLLALVRRRHGCGRCLFKPAIERRLGCCQSKPTMQPSSQGALLSAAQALTAGACCREPRLLRRAQSRQRA